MLVDKKIIITFTSRLFADEISKLQEKIGTIVPLKDPHKLQNLQSVGLSCVYSRESSPDYVHIFTYISRCTLAILEEVTPDTIVLTRIDPMDNYQIKNVYKPFFQWDSHSHLVIIPPVFGRDDATVILESNGYDLVFPCVVPYDLGQSILQRLFLYNLYSRIAATDPQVDMNGVLLYTTSITHMGRTYNLEIPQNNPTGTLQILDNLAIYVSIMAALLPRSCLRLVTVLLRHDEHELLDIFRGVIPPEIINSANAPLVIQDDVIRMETFISYLQTLSSIFNLGPKLQVASYMPETLTATCWTVV